MAVIDVVQHLDRQLAPSLLRLRRGDHSEVVLQMDGDERLHIIGHQNRFLPQSVHFGLIEDPQRSGQCHAVQRGRTRQRPRFGTDTRFMLWIIGKRIREVLAPPTCSERERERVRVGVTVPMHINGEGERERVYTIDTPQ